MMKNKFAKHILWLLCLISGLSAQKPGDWLFGEDRILEFHFQFRQTNFLDLLYDSHATGEYFACRLNVNGSSFDSVGVRFKGMSSFYGYPGDKKSLRVKFNKYRDFKLDGLKKVNLNNGWKDPTQLREKIYLDFFWQKQIAAPRANFARVFLNDQYWGLYTLVEQVDKVFLKNRFGQNDGNLFKAEYGPLVWKGEDAALYDRDFELKTNETANDWSALLELMAVLADGERFSTEISNHLDVDTKIRAWAANNLFANTDSYLGSATNYYLYQNQQSSQFRWIIWDVNLALGARGGSAELDMWYLPQQRPLHQRLADHEGFRQAYRDTLASYLDQNFVPENLFARMDRLWALIENAVLADTLKIYSNEEVQSALEHPVKNTAGLKPFITERRNWLLQQTAVKAEPSAPVGGFTLGSYPNPFNDQCRIVINLAKAGQVRVSAYDLRGRRVGNLSVGMLAAGRQEINWRASGLSSGIYFIEAKNPGATVIHKVLLVR